MIDFVKKYGYNLYSQNGEDGIIKEVMSRIPTLKRIAVEFGAADGFFCSNTANTGLDRMLFDVNAAPGVRQAEITPENVNELVPDCDILSIDIDGNDYAVWKAYKGKPAIVVIEVNSSYSPQVYHFTPETGCSYAMMNKLGEDKGYFLLCHTGNMIFVDKKYKHLFPEINLDPIINHEKFFNTQWLHSLPA